MISGFAASAAFSSAFTAASNRAVPVRLGGTSCEAGGDGGTAKFASCLEEEEGDEGGDEREEEEKEGEDVEKKKKEKKKKGVWKCDATV